MADIDIFSLKPPEISRSLKGKYMLIYGAPKILGIQSATIV